MGIKGLNDFLKKKDLLPFDLSLDSYRGQRVAIDATNWLFISWSIAWKQAVQDTDLATEKPSRELARKYWLQQLNSFIGRWLIADILPVFVFDGKHPVEKRRVQDKRLADREKLRTRLQQLQELIEGLAIPERLIHLDELRKCYINTAYPALEDNQYVRQCLVGLGLPVLVAKGEGERLCASLAIEGYVFGVFSTDSDLLALGCPLWLKETTKAHSLANVLSGLALTYQDFRDFCILCGCDYNQNLHLVGPVKSYNLLLKHGALDNVALTPEQHDRLQIEVCRQHFSYAASHTLIDDQSLTSQQVTDSSLFSDLAESTEVIVEEVKPLNRHQLNDLLWLRPAHQDTFQHSLGLYQLTGRLKQFSLTYQPTRSSPQWPWLYI